MKQWLSIPLMAALQSAARAAKERMGMKRWLSIPLMAATLLAIAAPAEAQPLDAAARQALRAELDAFFDQYYAWYSAGAADEIAGQAYNVPYVLGDGSALGTRDEVSRWVAEAWARLDAQGYAGSDMPDRNICVLGAGSAIVSGRGVRRHRDGGLLGEYGWTYSLVKTGAGWRIVSIFGHDPALAVRCP